VRTDQLIAARFLQERAVVDGDKGGDGLGISALHGGLVVRPQPVDNLHGPHRVPWSAHGCGPDHLAAILMQRLHELLLELRDATPISRQNYLGAGRQDHGSQQICTGTANLCRYIFLKRRERGSRNKVIGGGARARSFLSSSLPSWLQQMTPSMSRKMTRIRTGQALQRLANVGRLRAAPRRALLFLLFS
jgi:hypothetical protein